MPLTREKVNRCLKVVWEEIFNEVYKERYCINFREYLEREFNRMNDEIVERKVEE